MNVNKVFIVGRLTADPQVRTTPSGQPVATVSLATNRVWSDKNNQRQEATEYHNVVIWGRQAEVAGQFLTKGSLLCVEGRLQTRSWQDKQGQQRKTTEIVCENMQLGPRPAGGGGAVTAGNASWNARPQQPTSSGPAASMQSAPQEEIPVIDIDDGSIKPEDLPF